MYLKQDGHTTNGTDILRSYLRRGAVWHQLAFYRLEFSAEACEESSLWLWK